jgi:hypothetical protein
MKRRTVVLSVIATLAITLGACGDDSAFNDDTSGTLDPSAPGVTGTVPLPGPISWLDWTPAEAPDTTTEAQIVAGLEEMGAVMIIPASPSPTGEAARALMDSYSSGWGSGQTFAGTTQLTLELQVTAGTLVLIRSYSGLVDCSEGYTLTFRNDPEACAGDDDGDGLVQWREEGQYFEASFRSGLTLDQGLAWLETWRLLP